MRRCNKVPSPNIVNIHDNIGALYCLARYGYAVQDDIGNDFNKQETSDGGVVTGQYSVLLPDGRIQTVTYSVAPNTGFVAEVTYS